MITEIEIENFKSFGSPAEKIKLSPLNCVVGANASGKTNLVQGLRFLNYIAKFGFTDSFYNKFGGKEGVFNKTKNQINKPYTIRFLIKFEKPPKMWYFTLGVMPLLWDIEGLHYELIITINPKNLSDYTLREDVKINMISKNDNQKSTYELTRNGEDVRYKDIGSSRNKYKELNLIDKDKLALNYHGVLGYPCYLLSLLIKGWKFYNLDPNCLIETSGNYPKVSLGEQGQNLVSVLRLIEDENEIEQVISGLKGIIPGFEYIKTEKYSIDNNWIFRIIEKNIHKGIHPWQASEGTLRLIALQVIAWLANKQPSLIVIEEPEKGLHPHLSQFIIEILRTASQKSQIIFTTHNPDFLDFLEPHEVLLCDKIDGITKVKTAADIEDIEIFRKHFSLGELWVQGRLGGIP